MLRAPDIFNRKIIFPLLRVSTCVCKQEKYQTTRNTGSLLYENLARRKFITKHYFYECTYYGRQSAGVRRFRVGGKKLATNFPQ